MMHCILNLLDTHSQAIQAVSTIALVAVTIYYAIQTRSTVQAMRQSDELKWRPRMVLYLKQREGWLNLVELVIENQGDGAAKNLRFVIENDISGITPERKISEMNVLKNGIPHFAGKRKIEQPLLLLVSRVDELSKADVKIKMNYTDPYTEKKYAEEFELQFDSLIDRQIGSPPVVEIVTSLKSLADELKSIHSVLEKKT